MKSTVKAFAKGASALVAAGALLVGGAGVAFAATPPYEPDTTNQFGTLQFYDASGNRVTGGSTTDDPFAKYVVASSDDPNLANNSGALYGYLPVNGVPPANWNGDQLSGTTSFPVASPAWLAAAGTHRPVVTNGAGDETLAQLQASFPNNATDSYQGLYQLRIVTPGSTKWWAADIQITGTSWQVVYPGISSSSVSVAESNNPQTLTSQGGTPTATTITATVTPNVGGAVQFYRNGTAIGTPVAVSGGATNTATKSDVPDGPASLGAPVTTVYKAVFTPGPGAPYNPSTSADSNYVVQNPSVPATTTGLTTAGDSGFAGNPVTLNATVAPAAATGAVDFYDNGSATPLNPSPVTVAAGAASYTTSFTVGSHSIVAKFTSANQANYQDSQSSAVVLNEAAPTCKQNSTNDGRPDGLPGTTTCDDKQSFEVTVDPGTLTISTPYTPTNTFKLGTMVLDPTGTYLHTSAAFGSQPAAGPFDPTNPAKGVTITDTRSGDDFWNASVQSGDFVKGSDTISGANLGFTGVAPVYIPGNALNATTKQVVPSQIPNDGPTTVYGPTQHGSAGTSGLYGTAHQFAHADHGDGTVYVIGNMDLYAPTSTVAGIYTALVTFTIA